MSNSLHTSNFRIRGALAFALAFSSGDGATLSDAHNLGAVRVVSPADGARIASPFVVNIHFYPDPWMVATSDALKGYSICLAGGLRNINNAGLDDTLDVPGQVYHDKRCVVLQVDGSDTALPELNLPSSDSLFIGETMPSQAVWAWLQDPTGNAVGTPSAVAVDVYASKYKGMFAFGFEADSNWPQSESIGAGNNNRWSDDSVNANTGSNNSGGNSGESEDTAAWAYARAECARSNLRVLVFSNSTSFRTGRAMAHYAEGLLAAGCDAMVGFVGDASMLSPPTNNNKGRSSANRKLNTLKRDQPGSGGNIANEAEEKIASTYYRYSSADDNATISAAKISRRLKPRLVVYASWSELAKAAEQGAFDIVVLEKTGNDAERHPSATALEELKVPSVVLAVFALWQPHGSVCAPLSSCTEGWNPSWPVLPFVSPPPPRDEARASRAAAIRADLGIPPHELNAREGKVGSSHSYSRDCTGDAQATRPDNDDTIEHDDVSDEAPIVIGLIKGSAHDNDIVEWTKNALLELMLHDSRVHLVLLGAGYGWLQPAAIADYMRAKHLNLAESHDSMQARSDSKKSHFNNKYCAICREIEKRVHWIGPVADEAIKFDYLLACDLMFHVRAAGETFGNACAEFSHLGKPVITTYNGACAHRVVLGGSSSSSSSSSRSRSRSSRSSRSSSSSFSLNESASRKKFADGSPAAQLWNGAIYAVVNDAIELEAALIAVRQRNDLLRHSTLEHSEEPPPPQQPSPYAVFSPARVTRRLLELISLATAVKASEAHRALTKANLSESPFVHVAILGLRQGQFIDLGPAASSSPVKVAATPNGNTDGPKMNLYEEDDSTDGGDALVDSGPLRVNVEVKMLAGSDTNEKLERFPVSSWSLCLTADLPSYWNRTANEESGASKSYPSGSVSLNNFEVGHCARVVGVGDAPLKPLPVGTLLQRALRAPSNSPALAHGGKLIPVRVTARVMADDDDDGSAGGSDIELAYDSVVVLVPLPQTHK